jgi:predicted membrane GTPase involved in stress response
VFDVFANLGASDDQLDFPVLYASAREGWASASLPPPGQPPPDASMAPLLEALVKYVPPPPSESLQGVHKLSTAVLLAYLPPKKSKGGACQVAFLRCCMLCCHAGGGYFRSG